jgi:hypothetical protein
MDAETAFDLTPTRSLKSDRIFPDCGGEQTHFSKKLSWNFMHLRPQDQEQVIRVFPSSVNLV